MTSVLPSDARCQLYRLLGEPLRLRLLGLTAAEELSVGELAELLDEAQPNVSRHASGLRQAGVLMDRRQGTRVYIRLDPHVRRDPVLADAIRTGQDLCSADGSLDRIAQVVRARDRHTREFFSRGPAAAHATSLDPALPGYLFALGGLLDARGLAVDAGTGGGGLLDVLAPLFERVVALDRSEARLDAARRRAEARDYRNVSLLATEIEEPAARQAVGTGADLVICSRVLHHAPLPRQTVAALAELARPGGAIVIIDYIHHDDEQLREQQADVWMGFSPAELLDFANGAALEAASVRSIPPALVAGAPDHHVAWQVLCARRPLPHSPHSTAAP